MEQNKTRTYFLYAIGEIMLVVIGILIALQVNNWNEQRKELALQNQLIENYVNDLRSNQLYLNERIQPAKADQQFLNNASERLKASASLMKSKTTSSSHFLRQKKGRREPGLG